MESTNTCPFTQDLDSLFEKYPTIEPLNTRLNLFEGFEYDFEDSFTSTTTLSPNTVDLFQENMTTTPSTLAPTPSPSSLSQECPLSTPDLTHFPVKPVRSDAIAGRWSKIEDIFLTGVVLDAYFRRHSLKPSEDEKRHADTKGISQTGNSLVWFKIHQKYETACERQKTLTGEIFSSRTSSALQKHWKEIGKKRKEELTNEMRVPKTKQYERIWDDKYNVDGILLGPESKFIEYLQARKVSDTVAESRQVKRMKKA